MTRWLVILCLLAGFVGPATANMVQVGEPLLLPVITSELYLAATIGVPLSPDYQITATNPPLTSFTAAPLPQGLSLDSNTGVISGTPTQLGQTSTILTATNAAGFTSKERTLQFNIVPYDITLVQSVQTGRSAPGSSYTSDPMAVNYNNTVVLAITANSTAVNAVTVSNGSPCYAIANAVLGVNPNIFLWYCHIGASATVTFTITLASSSPYIGVEMLEFSGIAGDSPDAGLGAAAAYQSMSQSVVATTAGNVVQSGDLVISRAVCTGNASVCTTSNFPAQPGLNLTLVLNRILYATTTTAGAPISINWQSDFQGLGAVIGSLKRGLPSAPTLRPIITSDPVRSAPVNVPLSPNYQITATNGPFVSYTAVPLPPGLSLNGATGVISGIPTTIGETEISLTATNDVGQTSLPAKLAFAVEGTGVMFDGFANGPRNSSTGLTASATVNDVSLGSRHAVFYTWCRNTACTDQGPILTGGTVVASLGESCTEIPQLRGGDLYGYATGGAACGPTPSGGAGVNDTFTVTAPTILNETNFLHVSVVGFTNTTAEDPNCRGHSIGSSPVAGWTVTSQGTVANAGVGIASLLFGRSGVPVATPTTAGLQVLGSVMNIATRPLMYKLGATAGQPVTLAGDFVGGNSDYTQMMLCFR